MRVFPYSSWCYPWAKASAQLSDYPNAPPLLLCEPFGQSFLVTTSLKRNLLVPGCALCAPTLHRGRHTPDQRPTCERHSLVDLVHCLPAVRLERVGVLSTLPAGTLLTAVSPCFSCCVHWYCTLMSVEIVPCSMLNGIVNPRIQSTVVCAMCLW